MSFNAEWTNTDALAFRPYTAYASTPVTYSATTNDPMSDLQRENAKLRKLVIALQHCRDGRCDGECPMFTPADNNRGVPPVCEAYGVMRELGVEVDA